MAQALENPVAALPSSYVVDVDRSEHIWRAPLVPAALALTVGIVADRYVAIPPLFSLIAAVASLFAWLLARWSPATAGLRRAARQLPLVYLALALAAFGAAYQRSQQMFAEDDIGTFALAEPHAARVRGVWIEEPAVARHKPDPLQFFPPPESTASVLRVSELDVGGEWVPASGKARLVIGDRVTGLHVGDAVEAVGVLSAPRGPANPGEFDHAAFLRDQRIRAEFVVRRSADGVTRRAEGWGTTPVDWLAPLRGWGQRAIEQALPADTAGLAVALLLGEGSSMTSEDWQKYIRTGVIHVLAISGQHLVVLAGFLWAALRLANVRRRRGAWFVALFLLGYAVLAGGRPPVLRSAVMVCVACGGILLRRSALAANSFALAWIVVALLNPTDLFGTGCQLSFLAVATLFWGTSGWFRSEPDPLEQLIEESRPTWLRYLCWLGRWLALSYAVTAAIWLAVAPLVAARYQLVSPVALVIGPPMVVLSSIALLAGFMLLFASALCPPLVPLFALVTHVCLSAGDWLVQVSDRYPLYFYVGEVPSWWLWVFYAGLFGFLMVPLLRRQGRWVFLAAVAWLCVGLVSTSMRPAAEGLRCTFLAVGHGGCTVIETEDGRVLLYDAGALGGPEVTRRQIAPFLWHRGIRRIDEVFLSHADLDHFNGLPALLDRFAVGQITCTPSFADRDTPGVSLTLDAIQRHGIPMRIVRAGDRLEAGAVEIDVLHPPAEGPAGRENVRSLVLHVRHAGHSILLTGDLELAGLERVLRLPPVPVDVLMAPHHGSRTANTPELAKWARPRVVVACQGPPRGRFAEPYSAAGATYLGTWPHGAVTLHSNADELAVETFLSRQRIVIQPGER